MGTMTPKVMRFPRELSEALENEAKATGVSSAAIVRTALEAYLQTRADDQALDARLDGMEERLAATVGRLRREVQSTRNDSHVMMSMLDTFVRLYLLHTPPIPKDAVRSSAVAADERHAKFEATVVKQLQGASGLMERLNEAMQEPPAASP